MSFDKTTRNRLAKFVADFRRLITDEFTEKFQSLYGISARGDVAVLEKLTHLDETGLATAALLRERIDYLVKTHPDDKDGTKAAVERLAREQAFTVLNRLAAIRMAEKRGLIVESVGRGYQSKGFKVFETVAGSALGDAYHRYRRYLFCLFDELAIDLGVLFDRHSPQGLLFPREPALLALLDLLNATDLERLWAEDETIGWIYQYYNDPAERKKMRDESAAPRNSRELAVRNQFFTPRYVVEFLTDNTLGRIWYEITKGQTRLADQCRYMVRRPTEIFLAQGETPPANREMKPESLSQEELLQQPVQVPHRPLKDPREIRLLDPACGSMHFGLYAFDLFEVIYEEAWDLAETHPELRPLTSNSSTKEEFLRHVPRLIIENNIHGIDIDARAVQIAGLSLWLRAQKAWQKQNVKAEDRPRVRRSNLVCAEPMPGSPEMLEEFSSSLQPPLLGELVTTVFDKMQLAGEAGSLLKIEEEIRTAIDTAHNSWLQQQDDLLIRKDGSQGEFFETAEQQVIDALRAYAEQTDADSYQRRLFADDAARGFAFIDLCRKRYDAVVMNPPFGEASGKVITLLDECYPAWNQNMLCAFIARASQHRETDGKIGVIFDRTAVVKTTYEAFRSETLLSQSIESILDLGWNVLDANVEVISITLGKMIEFKNHFHTNCIDVRMVDSDSKGTNAADAISPEHSSFVVRNQASFAALPNQVIGYDFPELLLDIFVRFPALKVGGAKAHPGLQVKMDRYGRLRCEVKAADFANERYINMYNGSLFCRFYTPSVDCVLWEKTGEMLKYHPSTRWNNPSRYKCAGVGYGKRGDTLDAHVLSTNSIFTIEGLAVFPSKREHFYYYLAILNAPLISWIINYFCGQHKHAGYVDLIPVPPPCSGVEFADLDRIAKLAIDKKTRFNACHEVSALFITPWHIVTSLPERKEISWISDTLCFQATEARALIADLEVYAENAYGLSESDRVWLRPYLQPHFNDSASPYEGDVSCQDDPTPCAANILSYAVGNAFGRWDIRYATGGLPPPELPDPFDALPVCPPGMIQNAEGLPAASNDMSADYPLRISWPGILVEDENHKSKDGFCEDIVARVREAIEVVWKDRAEAIEQEACDILGVKTLRDYFRRPAAFFADHLKRYSKSRRQAPIYWPLSTKSGSYTLWLYYHRLTDQTLHTCLADFLDPKIRNVRSELDALTGLEGGGTRVGDLREFLDELKDLHDEIVSIIKLPWKPDLNDGVLITASPLWKLFRLPKWQKDLKACWDELAKGDYDWAHLAHSIWPQRVEKACEKDRSIAIAHGLEHLCKIEPPKPRKISAKSKAKEEEDEPELIEED